MLVAIPPMLPGALVAMLGFGVALAIMFASGGVAKRNQFGVIGQILSGTQGRPKRIWFIVALVSTVVGSCAAFAGVAVGDAQRREACEQTCSDRGYAKAKIQRSTEREPPGPNGRTFVACACSEGPEPDPLEFRADSLPAPGSGTAPAPADGLVTKQDTSPASATPPAKNDP